MHRASPYSRRTFLGSLLAAAGLAGSAPPGAAAGSPDNGAAEDGALVAITLDLEMSRNFPEWEATHWDYEKGNLNVQTKEYATEACRRVRERGAVIHTFCVGRVLEQEDVAWLQEIAAAGHPIGNHTYDHVNVLAGRVEDVQFRFQRAPWLLAGRTPQEAIAENVRLANLALQQRLGVQAAGFRTPGGFAEGLRGREDVQQMLLAQGFNWVSSLYPPHPMTAAQRPDEAVLAGIAAAQPLAQPFVYESGLVEIPMSPVSDIQAFRAGRWPLEDFLETVRRGVATAIQTQSVFDLLLHPSCLYVTDPEFQTIDLVCDLVEQAAGRARIVDLDVIARRAAAR